MQTSIISRKQTTIQTHNGVTVALSGWTAESGYHDADGFTDLALTMTSDANVANAAQVLWSNDGINQHGQEYIITSATHQYSAGTVPIKARYFKITVNNGDGAASHVMNAWAYLKA